MLLIATPLRYSFRGIHYGVVNMYEINDLNQLNAVSGGEVRYVSQTEINMDCFANLMFVPVLGMGAAMFVADTLIGVPAITVLAAGVGLVGSTYLTYQYASSIDPQCGDKPGFYNIIYS